jgi:hypothetical protein
LSRRTSTTQASSIMFGAFRATNPLSGGLLWYVEPHLGPIDRIVILLTMIRVQEDPMAALEAAKSSTAQTAARGGQRRLSG